METAVELKIKLPIPSGPVAFDLGNCFKIFSMSSSLSMGKGKDEFVNIVNGGRSC